MKKITLQVVLLFSLILIACKKNVQPGESGNTSITGKWKLSDYYGSPGGFVDMDSIPWIPVDASNTDFIEFNPDGTFIYSRDVRLLPDHYYITDSTITIVRLGDSVSLGYKIASPYLSLYGNLSFEAHCIEFCGTRYVSVK